MTKLARCYWCHEPLKKGVPKHCDAPGCDVCAACAKARKDRIQEGGRP